MVVGGDGGGLVEGVEAGVVEEGEQVGEVGLEGVG